MTDFRRPFLVPKGPQPPPPHEKQLLLTHSPDRKDNERLALYPRNNNNDNDNNQNEDTTNHQSDDGNTKDNRKQPQKQQQSQQQQQKSKKPPVPQKRPGEMDVVMGSSGYRGYKGNIAYRQYLVHNFNPQEFSRMRRHEARGVVLELVHRWKQRGGRFLTRDKNGNLFVDRTERSERMTKRLVTLYCRDQKKKVNATATFFCFFCPPENDLPQRNACTLFLYIYTYIGLNLAFFPFLSLCGQTLDVASVLLEFHKQTDDNPATNSGNNDDDDNNNDSDNNNSDNNNSKETSKRKASSVSKKEQKKTKSGKKGKQTR